MLKEFIICCLNYVIFFTFGTQMIKSSTYTPISSCESPTPFLYTVHVLAFQAWELVLGHIGLFSVSRPFQHFLDQRNQVVDEHSCGGVAVFPTSM
jgi:hypothetical protein